MLDRLKSLLVTILDLVQMLLEIELLSLKLTQSLDIGIIDPLEHEFHGQIFAREDLDVLPLVNQSDQFLGHFELEFLFHGVKHVWSGVKLLAFFLILLRDGRVDFQAVIFETCVQVKEKALVEDIV